MHRFTAVLPTIYELPEDEHSSSSCLEEPFHINFDDESPFKYLSNKKVFVEAFLSNKISITHQKRKLFNQEFVDCNSKCSVENEDFLSCCSDSDSDDDDDDDFNYESAREDLSSDEGENERQDDQMVVIYDNSAAFNQSDDDSESEQEDLEPVNCLFCREGLLGQTAALRHLQEAHQVDFKILQKKFDMDQYSFIKMINYIRGESITAEQLLALKEPAWTAEKYLKPQEHEPWLTYDYEFHTDAPAEKSSLQQIKAQYEQRLEQLNADVTQMRETLKRVLDEAPAHKVKDNSQAVAVDDGYFSSYAHYSIHHEMLSDRVRTCSYKDALMKNKETINNKTVLDVGCGTGILSIFASQAGASQVVGIDNSDIIYTAMEIMKIHKFENIKCLKGKLEDTKLPLDKFDIIISEWMGYFLLFEGMLDTVIHARECHLKPGGIILPTRCNISLCGYGDDELFKKHVSFWDDVYGINMSSLGKKVLLEPLVDIVDPSHILTNVEIIADFDMQTVTLNYSNFNSDFNFSCIKDGKLSAFMGYFDTFFELPQPVVFSTGPQSTPTHWKQCVFFLAEPLVVKKGDIVSGKFQCRRSRSNTRSLDIVITLNGRNYKYYFD